MIKDPKVFDTLDNVEVLSCGLVLVSVSNDEESITLELDYSSMSPLFDAVDRLYELATTSPYYEAKVSIEGSVQVLAESFGKRVCTLYFRSRTKEYMNMTLHITYEVLLTIKDKFIEVFYNSKGE